MALEQEIEIFSGNDVLLDVTVTDSDTDAALDLTGATALTWALAKSSQAIALVTKTLGGGVEVLSAVDGTARITLDSADTESLRGTYYHEMRLTNAAGKKVTVMYGAVEIVNNLIRD